MYVHKNLLDGRAVRAGSIYHTGQEEQYGRKWHQDSAKYHTSALSRKQQDFLLAKLKNTKKTKHAAHFLTAFNPSAEESLTYFDIIKRPMDLDIIETKLEAESYGSVQAFVDDLHLIFDNALQFHGPRHAVTEAASSMLAHVKRALRWVPGYELPNHILPNDMEVFTVDVDLDSHRALLLWSRWLYGKPMWEQKDCTDVSGDLACLVSIRTLCGGRAA